MYLERILQLLQQSLLHYLFLKLNIHYSPIRKLIYYLSNRIQLFNNICYSTQNIRMQITKKTITLAPMDRIIMITCYIGQLILFLYFNLLIIHYTFLPMPTIFSASSLVASQHKAPSYVYNGVLYALFFVQHVGMALIIFKLSLQSVWLKYPLYERYLYNISSSLCEIAIFNLARPVADIPIFTTPSVINTIFVLVASCFLMISIVKLGGSIFNPYSIFQILTGKSVDFEGYTAQNNTNLVTSGLYSYCRHPMQASVMILLLFASNIYTVDRLVFIFVHLIGIVIGVRFQENRLLKRFKGYENYRKQVPYMFIPYII